MTNPHILVDMVNDRREKIHNIVDSYTVPENTTVERATYVEAITRTALGFCKRAALSFAKNAQSAETSHVGLEQDTV